MGWRHTVELTWNLLHDIDGDEAEQDQRTGITWLAKQPIRSEVEQELEKKNQTRWQQRRSARVGKASLSNQYSSIAEVISNQ